MYEAKSHYTAVAFSSKVYQETERHSDECVIGHAWLIDEDDYVIVENRIRIDRTYAYLGVTRSKLASDYSMKERGVTHGWKHAQRENCFGIK